MPSRSLVSWTGPDPERVDAATIVFDARSLQSHGTSVTSEYALAFRLTTGPEWITRELHVTSRGDGWWRSLALRRGDDGQWNAAWEGAGGDQRPPELPDLRDALDCDLGLCPLTNTMPILRHDYVGAAHRGETGGRDFLMAWVSVPDLTVHQSLQQYNVGEPVHLGGALVGYASGRFRTTLEVDADGLVVNYPGLARRLDRVELQGRPGDRSN
jgi:hypothetical protein